MTHKVGVVDCGILTAPAGSFIHIINAEIILQNFDLQDDGV
jgi:hypothetical protein